MGQWATMSPFPRSLRLRQRPPHEPDLPGIWGIVRIDSRTKDLTKRLKSGDIAIIDHQDLDKVSAEALLSCKPVAVINAAQSITGRYPNMGPEILIDAGVPLLDNVGNDVMLAVKDGQSARLDGDTLYVGDVVVAKGILFDRDIVDAAMIEAGHRPHLIVGDMDSVSDATLNCGAEIVVHAYRDGRAPGLERVRKLGLDPVLFPATGTSEDVAMLLADDKGASLIVTVGTHATLVEFLDKGRSGMASTFLTRLRVGGKLVDAKGVSRLYRSRISNLSLGVMLLVGLFALFVALASTPAGTTMFQLVAARWDDAWSWIVGLFT